MADTYTDGNGVAGMLATVLAVDPTTVERACQSCGDRHRMGEHRAYRGAAMVLRCPGCGEVAARISERDGDVMVEWRGTYRVAVS